MAATDFPASPAGDFELHYDVLIVRILTNLRAAAVPASVDERLTTLFDRYPFLQEYERKLEAYTPGLPYHEREPWWNHQIDALEKRYREHLPIRALREKLQFSSDQIRMLLAAGIVEEDVRFGALFGALQEPLAARAPCLGLLGWLLGEPAKPLDDPWLVCRPLLETSLVTIPNQNEVRSEWVLRVPIVLWDALHGRSLGKIADGLTYQPSDQFPKIDTLILPETLHEQVRHTPALLQSGQISAVVLRGMNGIGRRTTLGALARATGRGVLLCETQTDETRSLTGPLATLLNAMPVLRFNPAPGETADLPPLSGYSDPIGITLGRSGGLRGDRLKTALSLTLPAPDLKARRRFWQKSHAKISKRELEAVSQRFLLTGGLIHRAAELASTYAALDERTPITIQDAQQAVRSLNRQLLDTLATPLEGVNGWDAVVMSDVLEGELLKLETRCRYREALREEAGQAFTHTLNRGVRAMFSGASGTGKTLAARALAAQLQMDLYRVDLAAVVNKYIGETERNLNEVLSRAEECDVLLLLDEGDALMTRRTDVSNANDRYANLETNYLLQRLESYEGIVIVTTNAAQRIDTAFLRRLDAVIEFSRPSSQERSKLWGLHLSSPHAIDPAFLDRVAAVCNLTGGQIRNAALYVAVLVLQAGEKSATDAHLKTALQHEYRKAGMAYPLEERPSTKNPLERLGIAAFQPVKKEN